MINAIAHFIVKKEKLPIEIDGSGRVVVGDGVYKVEWAGDEDGEVLFTIYSNGEWEYIGLEKFLSGRVMYPHSKRWISKLVKLGYPPEFAKMIWSEWMSLKWQAEDSK